MGIFRVIVSVVVGYVVFASASMFLVGQVMIRSGAWMVIGGLAGLAFIGLATGFIAKMIAGEKASLAPNILAGLVVLATLANLVMGLDAEPAWYKLGTLILTATIIFAVGRHRWPVNGANS